MPLEGFRSVVLAYSLEDTLELSGGPLDTVCGANIRWGLPNPCRDSDSDTALKPGPPGVMLTRAFRREPGDSNGGAIWVYRVPCLAREVTLACVTASSRPRYSWAMFGDQSHLDDDALKAYRKRARQLHQHGVEKPRQKAYAEMIHRFYPEGHAVLRYYPTEDG